MELRNRQWSSGVCSVQWTQWMFCWVFTPFTLLNDCSQQMFAEQKQTTNWLVCSHDSWDRFFFTWWCSTMLCGCIAGSFFVLFFIFVLFFFCCWSCYCKNHPVLITTHNVLLYIITIPFSAVCSSINIGDTTGNCNSCVLGFFLPLSEPNLCLRVF